MGITIKAVVTKLTSDKDSESTLTLAVPAEDYDIVHAIGKKTNRVLYVSFVEEYELKGMEKAEEVEIAG